MDVQSIRILHLGGSSIDIVYRTDRPETVLTDLDWSPDGTMIAFDRVSYRSTLSIRIMVVGVDGSNPHVVGPPDASSSTWSSDGSRIAFTRANPQSFSDIWVMNADGTDMVALTTDGRSFAPSWSRDGSRIVYTRRTGGQFAFDLFVMDADGSDRVRLTDTPRDETSPSWAPDGTLIVFERWIGPTTDLWTIEPSGSHPIRLTETPNISENDADWQPVTT